MMQVESSAMNRIAKYEKIKRIERLNDYEREKLKLKLEEKSKLIDNFKNQRNLIGEEKKQVNFNSYELKKEYILNYENIVKCHNGFDVSQLSNF